MCVFVCVCVCVCEYARRCWWMHCVGKRVCVNVCVVCLFETKNVRAYALLCGYVCVCVCVCV